MKAYNENLHGNAKPSVYENAKDLRKKQTEAEEKLWQNLRDRKLGNLKFRRQHPFENFILDFYCHEKKLCIEADGGIHNEREVMDYDENRTRVLHENGITVLRFSNEEIITNTDVVLRKIMSYIKANEYIR